MNNCHSSYFTHIYGIPSVCEPEKSTEMIIFCSRLALLLKRAYYFNVIASVTVDLTFGVYLSSKYSTGLCHDLIEIDRDRINGQLITRHSHLRRFAPNNLLAMSTTA